MLPGKRGSNSNPISKRVIQPEANAAIAVGEYIPDVYAKVPVNINIAKKISRVLPHRVKPNNELSSAVQLTQSEV